MEAKGLSAAWLLLTSLLTCGCTDDDPGLEESPSQGGGGAGAAAGESSVGGNHSGCLTGGAAGTAGTAGSSGGAGASSAGSGGEVQYTPDQLQEMARRECFETCSFLVEVCPATVKADCEFGCTAEVSELAESGHCAREFYHAHSCISGKLTASDVSCDGPVINGCKEEQAAFIACQEEHP